MFNPPSKTADRIGRESWVRDVQPLHPPPPELPAFLRTQHGSSDTLLEILLGMQQQMTLLQQQMAAQQQQIELQQQQHQAKPSDYFLALKKVHAPDFAGSRDPLEAEKWITEMEKFCRALCIPKDEWVNVTIPFLIADAEEWFISVRHAYEAGGVRIDWAKFREIFFLNYFPATVRIEKRNEFFNLKQGSMSVIQYASMFNQLGRFAPAFVIQEHSTVIKFEEGLNLNLREYMGTPKATTYHEVLEQALHAETLIKERNQIRDSSRPRPWNEEYEETEPAANKKAINENEKAIQEDLDGSTVHEQDDEKQIEVLHKRIIQLEKDLDQKHAFQLDIERLQGQLNVLKKAEELQKLLIEKEAELKDQANKQIRALNKRIIQLEKDLDKKDALQLDVERLREQLNVSKKAEELSKVDNDAREEPINDDLTGCLNASSILRMKRIEEMDRDLLKEAIKRNKVEAVEAEERNKAMELCSLWELYLNKYPNWHPRKIVLGDKYVKEVFDEDDERLNDFKAKYGDAVYDRVITAICSIIGYDSSGGYNVTGLGKDPETERRAALKDGVSDLLGMYVLGT